MNGCENGDQEQLPGFASHISPTFQDWIIGSNKSIYEACIAFDVSRINEIESERSVMKHNEFFLRFHAQEKFTGPEWGRFIEITERLFDLAPQIRSLVLDERDLELFQVYMFTQSCIDSIEIVTAAAVANPVERYGAPSGEDLEMLQDLCAYFERVLAR